MNLEDVQKLRNSITEIRSDQNLEHLTKHIGDLAVSSNAEHRANTAQLALNALTEFQNSFDEKMLKIDDVLSQLEVILQNK